MKTLTVCLGTFERMLSGLIESGVTFEAKEITGVEPIIVITFTGGF